MVEIADTYIGMRVVACVDCPSNNDYIHVGLTGTVCTSTRTFLGVRWDADIRGHTCQDACEDGYGWNVWRKEVNPLYEDLPDLDADGVPAGILLA